MICIDWLIQWFDSNKADLSSRGINYSLFVRNSDTDNPAQTVDIDTPKKIARVTMWESGHCNFESIESVPEGGRNVFEHQLLNSEEALSDFLQEMISTL